MAKTSSRMSSSAQLLLTGVVSEGITLALSVVAIIPFADADVATALLLLLLIVGGIASGVALICALVGLVKFRRFRWANIALTLASLLANPLTLLALYMLAY